MKNIEISTAARNKLLSHIADLTTDELNYIPTGFNNNLAWQMGHLVVSQQLLCYRLSGNELVIEKELVDLYKNGSKPERYISAAEIEQMKGYLLSTIDQLAIDLEQNLFDNYNPYTISTFPGLTLTSIDDAVAFIACHDGLHYGCCLGLKKLVKMQG
ncbi:DinB family protein [Pedobacter boryungensis]|uniref:DinB family protein n=1 Tax=Pedobacter boryungensis TaxID=869962 RepID=A0ABX2DFX6_9SPHI|nr:DinB family protein [Pedobacter boryungensis]NQX33001.1 DinB family protein [Pedobacter boryungensis]